jgi:GTP-binding protein
VERKEILRAVAGDIVSIAGFDKAKLTNTFTNSENALSISCTQLDPPLMSVEMIPNNSPFAGQNGAKKMSLFDLRNRLEEEAERDLALIIKSDSGNKIVMMGRGDLHIGILLERMRREGYEFQITSPTIITKEEKGVKMEPYELITLEIKFTFLTSLIEKVLNRKGTLIDSVNMPDDYQRITVEMSSRAAIGLNSELISETNNDAKYESKFSGYKEFDKNYKKVRKNILICSTTGKVTSYGMRDLERFGVFFIKPGNQIYKGQIIGISKDLEMELNPTKEKKLSNVRSVESEEAIRLSPPKLFSIEDAMTFILDDEYLEITPTQVRLRKIELNSDMRKKYTKRT